MLISGASPWSVLILPGVIPSYLSCQMMTCAVCSPGPDQSRCEGGRVTDVIRTEDQRERHFLFSPLSINKSSPRVTGEFWEKFLRVLGN